MHILFHRISVNIYAFKIVSPFFDIMSYIMFVYTMPIFGSILQVWVTGKFYMIYMYMNVRERKSNDFILVYKIATWEMFHTTNS